MNKTTFCVLMISLLLSAQVFSASISIEKWTDKQGKHHYGQRRVGSKVQSKQASAANKVKQEEKDKVKKEKAKKAPRVYKKPITKHKNPKDYSRTDF